MDAIRLGALVVKHSWLRAVNWLMFAIFLGSAFVQYNDSDWIFWVVLYLISAFFCIGKHFDFLPRAGYWVFSLLVYLTAVYWLQSVPNGVDVFGSLTDTGMVQPGSERVRELGGLVLVGTWTAILGLHREDQ